MKCLFRLFAGSWLRIPTGRKVRSGCWRGIRGCALWAWLGWVALRADVPVEFSNLSLRALVGFDRPVLDTAGQLLADTNYSAQLFRVDGSPVVVAGPEGSRVFAQFSPLRPGYFVGGSTRTLKGVNPGQPVQLEVRVWNLQEFASYEAAVAGGGITGSTGPFRYLYQPSPIPVPADQFMREFPGLRLKRNPLPPPTVTDVLPVEIPEQNPSVIRARVVGGRAPLRYQWFLAGGVVVETPELRLPLPGQTLMPGILSATLVVTDADGQGSQPFTQFIQVLDLPGEVLGVTPNTGAEGSVVTLQARVRHTGGPGSYRLRWSFPDGTVREELSPSLRLPAASLLPVGVEIAEGPVRILYDNFFCLASPPNFHVQNREFGDEVAFATTNRFLDQFTFFYYADLSQMSPAERAAARGVVRMYRQDGPILPGKQVSRYPGTLLHQSEPFPLSQGYTVQRFDNLGLEVPDRLTWTIEWLGVPQTAGRTAGLVLADSRNISHPDAAGTSYNDFWIRVGEAAWELFHFGNFTPVADFSSRHVGPDRARAIFGPRQNFLLQVTNLPPVLASVVIPGQGAATVPLDFQALGSDAGPLTYLWTFGDGRTAAGPQVQHAYATPGIYPVEVMIRDASGAEVRSRQLVEVVPQRLPLVAQALPPLEVREREPYRYEFRLGTLGAGQKVSVRAGQLPRWATLTPTANGADLTGTPTPADLGPHEVQLFATDGVATLELPWVVTVRNVNDPPTLAGPLPASGSVRAGARLGPLVFTAADPDPDETLEFEIVAGPASLLPPGSLEIEGAGPSRQVTLRPPRGVAGNATLTVRVRDLSGESASATFSVQIDPTPAYSLAVTAGPGGSVEVTPVGDRFEEGTAVRAEAVPAAGYAFTGWVPARFGTNAALEFVLQSNSVVQATFRDIAPPAIAISSPAPGASAAASVTFAGTVTDNDSVSRARWWFNGQERGVLPLDSGRFHVPGLTLRTGPDALDRENVFTVVAEDPSGNAVTNSLVVVWTPNAVLAVGSPDETVEGAVIRFPLQLKTQTAVAGLSLRLRYDADFLGEPTLEWIGAAAASLGSVNTATSGVLLATVAAPQDLFPAGLETIAIASFRVRSLPFRLRSYLEPELLEISNALGDPIPGVDAQFGGAFLRPRRIKGDVNGNGRLDVGDASLVQRLSIGLETARSWDTGLNDLNGNNRIDSGDIVRILRVVGGLDPQPPGAMATPLTRGARPAAPSGDPLPGAARLEPAAVVTQPGRLLTLKLQLPATGQPVRGAALVLDYPKDLLALRPNGIRAGAAVPAGTAPSFTNELGGGRIWFAAASPTNWLAPEAVLVELDFVVAGVLPDDEPVAVQVRRLELTSAGYDTRLVPVNPMVLSTPSAARQPRVVGLTGTGDTGWRLDVLAAPDSILVLETATELGQWTRRGSYRYSGEPLLFDPADAGEAPGQYFFRIQSYLPALGVSSEPGGRPIP